MANVNDNKVITVSFLQAHGACQEGIAFFERNFPETLFPQGIDLSKIKVTGDYNYYFHWLSELPICAYDDKGNKIKEIYSDGDIYQYEYDEKGNMTKKIFPSGYYIQYEYNTKGQVIKEINSNGHIYKYEYDEKGNMIKEILPGNYIIKYEYNDTGNMTKKTSPSGDVYQWEYKYDEMGRLIKAGKMTIEYLE